MNDNQTRGMAEVQAMAKVLYVAANWQETISEPDGSTKPQPEYERRAAEKWDKGTAGWSNYQRYPRYAAALSAAGFGPVKEVGAPQLKRVRGELKSLGKHLDSWDSEGHTTVTIRFMRNWIKARNSELSKP